MGQALKIYVNKGGGAWERKMRRICPLFTCFWDFNPNLIRILLLFNWFEGGFNWIEFEFNWDCHPILIPFWSDFYFFLIGICSDFNWIVLWFWMIFKYKWRTLTIKRMQRKKSGAKMRVFLFERTDALWKGMGICPCIY